MKTEEGQLLVREHPAGMGGSQRLYRYPNGYGASVVQFSDSYGGNAGLWELAVLKYHGEGVGDFKLCYTTPVTDDVIGHLSNEEVHDLLAQIRELP